MRVLKNVRVKTLHSTARQASSTSEPTAHVCLRIVSTNPRLSQVLADELGDVPGVVANSVDIIDVESDWFRPNADDVIIVSEAAIDRWCRHRDERKRADGNTTVIGAIGTQWMRARSAIAHGFDGCVDLRRPARDIVDTLDAIRRGDYEEEVSVDSDPGGTQFFATSLCQDQTDSRILAFVTMGLSDREIGAKVFLSSQTVRNRVSKMLERSHLANRTQLAVACVRFPQLLESYRYAREVTPR